MSESLTYDVLNRRTGYAGPNGSETTAYRGAEWHRWQVAEQATGATSPDITSFLYDGDNVVGDYTGANLALSRLYVTPGLDENLSMTVVSGADAGTYYYSQDGLGSVRTLTDAAGAVRNRHDYTAFGEDYGSTVTLAQRYGYASRENLGLSGGMHYRYRNYAPDLGRFDRRDPAGYYANAYGNLYDYVAANPVLFTDPWGLWRSGGHIKLTKEAIIQTECSLPGDCMEAMMAANNAVDGDWWDATLWLFGISTSPESLGPHGMLYDDDITGAVDRSEKEVQHWLNLANGYARRGMCNRGAVALGKALHTIQDRFAHSFQNGEPMSSWSHRLRTGIAYLPFPGTRGFVTDPDIEDMNPGKYSAALEASVRVAEDFVNTLIKEGCFKCQ